MNKLKSLAEQANRFMSEDYLSAPQPSTDFDPFTPNYGSSQTQAKLPISGEKKPVETDVEKKIDKTELESPDNNNDDGEKGNKSYIQKVYIELSEMFKDVVAKSKDIDNKLTEVSQGVDNASDEQVVELEDVSKQLHNDVEQFAILTKSILEILNSIEYEPIEKKDDEELESDEEEEE